MVKQTEYPIYFADDLIAIYTAFKQEIFSSGSVLYPSCGYDASPARVFDKVMFVDKEDGNEGCVSQLQKAGLNAIKQDIREYDPSEKHDLLILLNPAIPVSWATPHLISGGYVIANNYHGSATSLYTNQDEFLLWGTMDFLKKDSRKNDFRVNISRDLTDLFQPVKDGEEFRSVNPDGYEFIHGLVEHFIKQGILQVESDLTFEQKWEAYRNLMDEKEMPYRRVAERYIFMKR